MAVITHDSAQLPPPPPPPPSSPPADPPTPPTPPTPPAPYVMEILEAPEPPSPDEIDAAILRFEAADIIAEGAKEKADELKKELIQTVDSFGRVPAHAEQSKRLDGRRNSATITRGTSITVKEDAVDEFRNYLHSQDLLPLFPRFFASNTKHTLVEGATDVLKTIALNRRTEEKVASLFGRAFDVSKKAPTLKTHVIKPEKLPRKRRGGKAAA